MITTITRIFLGLVFTVFGLNGFFNFIPPPEMPAEAGAFVGRHDGNRLFISSPKNCGNSLWGHVTG